LKRDAVPIRFDVTCSQKEYETFKETRENNERMIDVNEDVTPSTSLIDVIEKQLFHWLLLKTYVSPRLSFDIPSEEEDIMEWEHLEPLTNKNICVQKSSAINEENKEKKLQKNEENNTNKEKKLQIIINSLKRENIRLCRTVNDLKFCLSIRKQVPRKKQKKCYTN